MQVRNYTSHAGQSRVYRPRQPRCKELCGRSTLGPAETWAARPLPARRASGYICPRQPCAVACPLSGGNGPDEEEDTRMAALDHVSLNGDAPFTPPSTADEAREYIRANGIEFLFAQFVDMHGKPNAKLVPSSHFEDLLADGAGFAGFAAGDIGQTPNSPDMAAMPDIRTLTPLPFRPGVARI